MGDPKLRFTLTWGDMTIELKGDAASVLRELESLKGAGIGQLASFFALRSSLPAAPAPIPSPSPGPGPAPGPVPVPEPGGGPAPPPTPHGDFFGFALDRWELPGTSARALAVAANIDGDPHNRPDNLFGSILSVFAGQGLDFATQPLGTEVGSVAPLLRLQTVDPALRNDENANVVLMLGQRIGSKDFLPDSAVAPASFFGRLVEGQFVSEPRFGPASPLDVTIPGPLSMRFLVTAPRIQFRASAAGLTDGALQGAIPADAFREVFLSSLAQWIADQVASQPDSSTTTTLISVFGGDAVPGTIISVDQWRQALEGNPLLETLLKPDVVLNGTPAVSFGIGFAASPAAF